MSICDDGIIMNIKLLQNREQGAEVEDQREKNKFEN